MSFLINGTQIKIDDTHSVSDKISSADSHASNTSNPHSTTASQVGAEPANANIQNHIASTSNPHSTTAAQVGAEPSGSVSTHNSAIDAHSDIRSELLSLSDDIPSDPLPREADTLEGHDASYYTTYSDTAVSNHNISGTAHSDIRSQLAQNASQLSGLKTARNINTALVTISALKYYNYTTGNLDSSANTNVMAIVCGQGTVLNIHLLVGGTPSVIKAVAEVDGSNNRLAALESGEYTNYNYTVQHANTTKVYVTYRIDFPNKIKIVEAPQSTDIIANNINYNTWGSYGDSITSGGLWQPPIIATLGLTHSNYGVSGTKVADTTGSDTTAMCRDERVNAITLGTQLISVFGGHNDWSNDVPLGSSSDTVTTSFWGAYRAMLEKLVTRFPSSIIFVMSIPFGINTTKFPASGGMINTLGLGIIDYNAVIKSLAEQYGCEFINVYGESGINKITVGTYTSDGVHPNKLGGYKIAEPMIKQMRLRKII